jgi:hypothetical protein
LVGVESFDHFCLSYSYLRASTGFSFDALQAGYNAKITLTPMPNANARIRTSGVSMGVMAVPWPSPKGPPPWNTTATTFANPQPKPMPMAAPMIPIMADSKRNMESTVLLFIPKALSIPISRVRSIKETIIMFIMPMPATSSDMAPMPPRNSVIVANIVFINSTIAFELVTVTWLLKFSDMSFETSVMVLLSLLRSFTTIMLAWSVPK